MIEVTRLDGSIFYLNPHQIETIEARPDTAVTLISGKRMVLRDSLETIRARIVEYRKSLFDLSHALGGLEEAIGALQRAKNADKVDN